MVDGSSSRLERQVNFQFCPSSTIRIQRKLVWMGWREWSLLDWRRMVSDGVVNAHKLFRIACRFLCDSSVRPKPGSMFHSCQNGQSNSNSLHQPPRGYSFKAASKSSKTILGVLSPSSHFNHSRISAGSNEHSSKLVLPSPQGLQQLETHSRALGSIVNRSVCILIEQPTSKILQLETRSFALALTTDAFLQPCNQTHLYAFPPFLMIPRCLSKIRQELSSVIIVPPFWTSQIWYLDLLQMSVDFQFYCPIVLAFFKMRQAIFTILSCLAISIS